jgi:beta-galactosidase
MGMMMMCETRNEASTPEGLDQLSIMIKRYRNSPSIILWSIGNEEDLLQRTETGERVGRSMVDRAHELDPTRPCTSAINSGFGSGTEKALDVMGFNYGLSSIDPFHQSNPRRGILGSETASSTTTRGVYETDKLRNTLSAYGIDVPSWAETAEQWWQFYAEREYLAGGFAWTGFDYRGEPYPYGWPSISSQYGILDTCGYPKDIYFYYKAWWATEPVLHLFPHWNWEERFGQPINVWVHSNLDEVELFLNGKSLGSQKVKPRTHLAWNVQYEPGVIEARGSKAGKVVLTEKRETTGKLAAIRLTPDRAAINADGEDIAILRVEGVDDQGRVVATADTMIQFKAAGAGALIGVGNGDPNCLESDKESKRSLFNGLAQVIVQASKTPGDITIEAWSEDWPGPKMPHVTTIIKTLKANMRPGI